MKVLAFCSLLSILVHQTCCVEVSDCKKTSHLAPVRLKNDILCDYDKTARPVVNHLNATNVTMRMILKFFSYDMHSNAISVHDWLAIYWKDEHLKWDPAKYESIKQIHLSTDDIWVPDLSVYNRNDQSGSPKAISSVSCLVFSVGAVVCISPGRHDALCTPNLAKYPYDVQNCSLRFGSWVHSGEEIDFRIPNEPVVLDDYIPNGEWKLISVIIRKYPGNFNCCPNNSYPSIGFNFLIERHSATQAATIVIPALVMIIITLTTLWMDPQEIDRLCLACCNVITHILYIQFLNMQLPSSGDNPPLLILFARDSLLLCMFSLCLTVILKPMMTASKQSPALVSLIVDGVLNNRPGQFLLLYDNSLKEIASAKGEEDGANIINNEVSPASKDWHLFGKLLDRLSFIGFAITYFYMFIAFIA